MDGWSFYPGNVVQNDMLEEYFESFFFLVFLNGFCIVVSKNLQECLVFFSPKFLITFINACFLSFFCGPSIKPINLWQPQRNRRNQESSGLAHLCGDHPCSFESFGRICQLFAAISQDLPLHIQRNEVVVVKIVGTSQARLAVFDDGGGWFLGLFFMEDSSKSSLARDDPGL